MKTLFKCSNCQSELVLIEDKLFYSGKESEIEISCPICVKIVCIEKTDGWFFIQTRDEYQKDQEIEKNKERFVYPMP